MNGEPLYLSLKDILRTHRIWITELYTNAHKSDVEITVALQERGIAVSLQQVRECLQEWGIFADPILRIRRLAMEDNYTLDSSPRPQLASSMPRTTPDVTIHATTSSHLPTQHESHQPPPSTPLDLPPYPSSSASPVNSGEHDISKSSPDLLKLTCHHGPTESHEVYFTLDFLPKGPSQMELYANEEQNQETPFFHGGYQHMRAQDVSRNATSLLRKDIRQKRSQKTRRLKGRDALNNKKGVESRRGSANSCPSRTLTESDLTDGGAEMGKKSDEEAKSPK